VLLLNGEFIHAKNDLDSSAFLSLFVLNEKREGFS
jgi:hypothetical protein